MKYRNNKDEIQKVKDEFDEIYSQMTGIKKSLSLC